MFFSVIIPTFNRAPFLVRTLESVRQQTFTDYQVVVVDDGSTDNTLEQLREYSWVDVLTQKNRGPGAARNLGASRAKGEYLAFLDSDDLWFPWTLATYASVIQQAVSPTFMVGKPMRFRDEATLAGAAADRTQFHKFPDYLASG